MVGLSNAPRLFDLGTLTITVLGLSVFTAWLRLRSGSLWPSVVWHGGHNLFIQEVFVHVSFDTGPTEYVIDDFGLGLVLAALALGYICWRKRFELSQALNRPLREAGLLLSARFTR